MARWKLMTPHYLNVPNEEWEYVENDRKTGRPKRHKFSVPRYLDPKDPSCWTKTWGAKGDEDGEIIVCFEGKGESDDITFFGNPTPDMSPVDDEAREISAKFEELWRFKPENSAGEYSQSLVDKFQSELAEAQSKPQTVEVAGLADLVAQIGALVETVAKPERRV
jgi:hypothetical protein